MLSNFVVAENPSYGAEPMLRADTVTAYLRLTSLWRGRLEIGTLDLDSPSLNLVRRSDGHWNVEELVERASQVSSAPTTQARPEVRPRFPYVEASSGRINFKLGQVKKAFAFTDADFALWLESEEQWGIRLEARPMRTDVDVHDTGILKLDGHFQRAASLRDTPLDLKLTFSGGPLGQLTKLIYGRDRGWRGNVQSNATLTGTPAALGVTLDAQVDNFRRYDIALGEALRLLVHCTGTYSSPDDALHELQCQSPVGAGVLEVRGNAQGWAGDAYDLSVSAERIPAARMVALARHAKKDLPADLTATGEFEGTFSVRKSPGGMPVWARRRTHRSAGAAIRRVEAGFADWDYRGRDSRARLLPPIRIPGVRLPAKFRRRLQTLNFVWWSSRFRFRSEQFHPQLPAPHSIRTTTASILRAKRSWRDC